MSMAMGLSSRNQAESERSNKEKWNEYESAFTLIEHDNIKSSSAGASFKCITMRVCSILQAAATGLSRFNIV